MKAEIKKFRRTRALIKRRITACIQLLTETLVQDASLYWVAENKIKIKSLMNKVHNIHSDIVAIFGHHQVDENDEIYIKEADTQIEFLVTIGKQMRFKVMRGIKKGSHKGK